VKKRKGPSKLLWGKSQTLNREYSPQERLANGEKTERVPRKVLLDRRRKKKKGPENAGGVLS